MTSNTSPSAAEPAGSSPGEATGHALTDDERVAALQIGALVLSTRWPRVRAYVHVRIGADRVAGYAQLEWPGVVMVSDRFTGQVFARSKAGMPFSIDWTSTPRAAGTNASLPAAS